MARLWMQVPCKSVFMLRRWTWYHFCTNILILRLTWKQMHLGISALSAKSMTMQAARTLRQSVGTSPGMWLSLIGKTCLLYLIHFD